jgi:hypothetical protein
MPGTVTPDVTPPTIISISPPDGAADVDPSRSVVITFSEPVAPDSTTAQTVILTDQHGAPVESSIRVDGSVLTLVPSDPYVLTTAYRLSVTTGVRDLAGNALEDAKTSQFKIRDGAWGGPVAIGSHGRSIRVAFDGAGRALAVWLVGTTSSCVQGAALYEPNRWTGLPDIQQPPGGTQCSPNELAGDADGRFLVSWTSQGAQPSASARVYDVRSGWGDSVNGVGGTAGVHVAIKNGHGWVLAATVLPPYGLYAAEFHAESGWQTFAPVYPAGTDGVIPSMPRGGSTGVVMDAKGNANALYSPSSGPGAPFIAGLRHDEASWSGLVPISSLGSDATVANLFLSSADDGHAFAIWRETQGSPSVSTIKVSSLLSDGSWSIPAEPWSSPIDGVPSSGRVAAGGTGDGLVVWAQSSAADQITTTAQVWGSSLAGGATAWSAPEPLSDSGIGLSGTLVIAADQAGSGIALWNEASGVKSARFLKKTGWVSTGSIATSSAGAADAHIALDRWGRGLAVWLGADDVIWAARFE